MALCNDRRCGCSFEVDDSAAAGITLTATGTGDSGDPYVITVATNLATLLSDNIDDSTLKFVAGKVEVADGGVTVDKIAAEPWTAYDCAWGATGGAPSINSGVVEARYIDIGNTCHFSIHVVTAVDTNGGAGGYSFAIPHSPYGANTNIIKPFYGNVYDDNTGINVSTVLLVRQTNNYGYLYKADATATPIANADPITLTATANISINITGTFEF